MSVLEAVLQTLNSLTFNSSNAGRTSIEPENLELMVWYLFYTYRHQEKLRIFHSLPVIATNLGVAETREKLIPIIEGISHYITFTETLQRWFLVQLQREMMKLFWLSPNNSEDLVILLAERVTSTVCWSVFQPLIVLFL